MNALKICQLPEAKEKYTEYEISCKKIIKKGLFISYHSYSTWNKRTNFFLPKDWGTQHSAMMEKEIKYSRFSF